MNKWKEGVLHLLFWLLVILIFYALFLKQGGGVEATQLFIIFYMPITMVATYWTGLHLIPHYLLKGRTATFLLYYAYTLIGTFYLFTMTSMGIYWLYASIDLSKMPAVGLNLSFLGLSLGVVLFSGNALFLLKYWGQEREKRLKLALQQRETELLFLKNQLNPHFLFNTLNNLYSLSLKKSDLAPEMILKLSALLNYMLYQTKDAREVAVSQELEQLDNFLSIEKIRYGDRVAVTQDLIGDFMGWKIPPMLLLTLLENSFKHGVGPVSSGAWVNIQLEADAKKLSFKLANSLPAQEKGGQEGQGGLGLENIQRQLQLLYPDRHQLTIDYHTSHFQLCLQLYSSH